MENSQEQNPGVNFAFVETHLQVSNLVKILLTVPFDILKASVENVPTGLKDTQHAKILGATLEYYEKIISSVAVPEGEQTPQSEEPETKAENAPEPLQPELKFEEEGGAVVEEK